MEHFQQYVPVESETSKISIPGVGEKEIHSDKFHHILFGGDLLTAKRARGSQYTRSNSLRGKDRLEGFKPVVEDWHAKMCFIGVSLSVYTTHVYYTLHVRILYGCM